MDPRDEWRNPDTEALFQALLTLQDGDDVARFCRDLLTFNELTELGQRWAIVRKLEEGVPYRRIAYPPYDLAAEYYWGEKNPYKIMKAPK